MTAYLNTRVTLYAQKLWKPGDFDALLDVPPSTLEAFLAGHGLPQLALGYGHAEGPSLEQRIIARVLEETEILLRPLQGAEREFLRYWTARFEISNVKTLLRGKMTGDRPALLLSQMIPMGRFTRLDNHALAHTEDVGELLRLLEAGPYAEIVRQARRAFEQGHDPFILDATLDRRYYEGLLDRAQPLEEADHGDAGHTLATLIGNLVDTTNVVWLLRYRFNYGLPPSQVYYLLVSARDHLATLRLSRARLRELASLESHEATLHALGNDYPKTWRDRLAHARDIPGVMATLENLSMEQARTAIKAKHAAAISRTFAYLLLREHDLRAVRAILRGRHLGLPGDAIRLAMQRSRLELM